MPQFDLYKELKHTFGYDTFRPGQKESLEALLDGRDCIAVLPTGSGKSLIFQMFSQLTEGTVIVVSPLLALMKDQVEEAEIRGIDAGSINSHQDNADQQKQMRDVKKGKENLLYVTPERFKNAEFMKQLKQSEISLFVIDEAHCISEWGHDFRPAYLDLSFAIKELGNPLVLALTATAAPFIRQDIINQLSLENPKVIVKGINRRNLFLEVIRVHEEPQKKQLLFNLLTGKERKYEADLHSKCDDAMKGSGVIYCQTTKGAEETAQWLNEWGIPSDYYHGQRDKAEREAVQDKFMNDKIRVIAATNAFGLGINKEDIRFIIHRDIPGSLESYYQEAGRAGRDRNFALCTIMYQPKDLGRAAFLSGSPKITRDDVVAVLKGVNGAEKLNFSELKDRCGLGSGTLISVLSIMAENEVMRREGEDIFVLKKDINPDLISLKEERAREEYEKSRLEMIRAYAETDGCRRTFLLNYFGEDNEKQSCTMCDNDAAGLNNDEIVKRAPFPLGSEVAHKQFGKGTVTHVEEGSVTVLFENNGYQKLNVEILKQEKLLKKLLERSAHA
jgi:ATP-dependent DNA helicase RecQ